MRKIILALIAVFIIVGACSKSTDTTTNATTSAGRAAAVTPEPELIKGDERKAIVSTLTKGLELERDKVEKISFYSAKNPNYLKSRLEAYISVPDTTKAFLRMKSVYYGDDWVFYNSVKIMADDVVIYDHDFGQFKVQRNNSGGSVWETADILASPLELKALKTVANSKSATIRFLGRERREDHEITSKERKDLKKVIDIYEKLNEQLVRSSAKAEA